MSGNYRPKLELPITIISVPELQPQKQESPQASTSALE